MNRIAIIAPDLSVKGGVSSVIRSVIAELGRRGNRVKLYSTYIDSVHPLLRVVYSLFRILLFLARLEPFKSDIFYFHVCAFGSFYRKSFYVLLLRLLGKPVILHQHAADLELFLNKNRFNKWLGKLVYRSSTMIFVLSQDMKNVTEAIVNNNNVHIVENPIHIPELRNAEVSRQAVKDRIGLVFLGEIGKRKGIYDLIQAISELTDEQKGKIRLDIGGNKELDKLAAMIKEYGVEDICVVHGWVQGEKKQRLLREADVFVLPSYFEGVPIAILEAMSYGLPVISTNIAGIPEIVVHHHNGLIVKPGDIEALKTSIVYWIENEERIAQYGSHSRSLVEKHEVSVVVDKIERLFASGIEGARKSKLKSTA